MGDAQAMGQLKRAGPASDVYDVLTGRPPFTGDSALEDARRSRRRWKPRDGDRDAIRRPYFSFSPASRSRSGSFACFAVSIACVK